MKTVLFTTMLAVFLGVCFIPQTTKAETWGTVPSFPWEKSKIEQEQERQNEAIKKQQREIRRQNRKMKNMKRNKMFGWPAMMD